MSEVVFNGVYGTYRATREEPIPNEAHQQKSLSLGNDSTTSISSRLVTLIERNNFLVSSAGECAEQRNKGITSCEAALHLFKSMVGVSIFLMPYALAQSGVVEGIFLLGCVAIYSFSCFEMLVFASQSLAQQDGVPHYSFSQCVQRAMELTPFLNKFAKCASRLVSILIILSSYSAIMLYIIVISSNLKEMLSYLTNRNIPLRLIIGFMFPLLLPISTIANLKKLTVLTVAGILFLWTGIIATLIIFFVRIYSNSSPYQIDTTWGGIEPLFIFLSIAVTSFSTISVILPIENNMKNPSALVSTCPPILLVVIILGYILYVFYGVVGYHADCSQNTMSRAASKFQAPTVIVKTFISIGLYFSTPILMFASHTIITNVEKLKTMKYGNILSLLIRALQTAVVVSIPLLVVDVSALLNLVSGLPILLQFVVPVFLDSIIFVRKMSGIKFYIYATRNAILIGLGSALAISTFHFGVKKVIDLYSYIGVN